MSLPPHRSALAAFFAVNLLALTIALGLSGSVVLVSWLVPTEGRVAAPEIVVD